MTGEIQRAGGRITFEQYMDLALYDRRIGYYQQAKTRIGRQGDYFTSVSVSPLFGKILAEQIRRFRRELGEPADFMVVEFGGSSGTLRDDILAVMPGLDYRIVEVGRHAPESICGCILSNEFLDALPVHRVRVVEGNWVELYVKTTKSESGPLEEITGPVSDPRVLERLAGLPIELMEGYTTEVNLRALDWVRDAARRLSRGFVLTLDYGFTRPEFFSPPRARGTFRCYYRHTLNDDPFQNIGEQDMTAHVEFSSLMEEGEKTGLRTILFEDQAHYLLEMGKDLIEQIVEKNAGRISPERQAVHQLIHPGMMGSQFKVLIQQKV